MSKDTIYRQDAIDAVCKACSMEEDYHKCDGYPETSTWCDELVALRALPSAQPEPKKGEWILMSDADGEYYACSECGEELPYCSETPTWDKPYPRKQSIDKTDFCPNCGADMRGEQDG